jgi:hypothetical protein
MTHIPVLRVEPGVKFDCIAPAGARIIAAVDGATKVLGIDLWISSGTEGHGPTSPHTKGEAYDVSVKDMSIAVILKTKQYLELVLGTRFTVLYVAPSDPTDPNLLSIAHVNRNAAEPYFHIQAKKGTVYPPPEPVDGLDV